MPPRSEKQRRLFRAAAADPALRERKGISKKVAVEFNESDPGGKLPTRVTASVDEVRRGTKRPPKKRRLRRRG
jgi:hypothetical protein